MTKEPGKKEKFEDHLRQVEQAVKLLESGNLGLEESLEKYETGIQALKRCYEILGETKKKIEILMKEKDGSLSAHNFDYEKSDEKEQARRKRKHDEQLFEQT